MIIGRNSTVSTTEACLEIKEFAGNHPQVYKVTLNPKNTGPALVFTNIKHDSINLNSGKNGWAYWDLEPGIYKITGILETGSRITEYEVKITESEVEEIEDILEEAREMYPGLQNERIAIEAKAKDIMVKIKEERKEMGVDSFELRGFTVIPKFTIDVDIEKIKFDIATGNVASEDAYIVEQCKQSFTILDPKVIADTAEAAVEKAIKLAEERSKKEIESLELTKDLPELTGTPRQIKWAITLRADVFKKDPKNPALKKATTAKYWIENR